MQCYHVNMFDIGAADAITDTAETCNAASVVPLLA